MHLLALAATTAVALAVAPAAQGQSADRNDKRVQRGVFFDPGSRIGVSVRDVEAGDSARAKPQSGASVEDVRAGSPAEKAGIRQGDVVTDFDGERVRSARQFARLVDETPAGRTVKATIVRDGQRKDIEVTPEADRRADLVIDGDRLRARVDELSRNLPQLNFEFNPSGAAARARLGVTLTDLTPQLASYFGATEGVLVSAVHADSAAARAGLHAGDVITTVNGQSVRSASDLAQAIRSAGEAEMTIGIVRDKKETTLKARIEPKRGANRTGRPA
jgi:serine protease Do